MPENVTFDAFRSEWMHSILAIDPTTVQLGNRFAQKLVTQWLDVDPDTEDDIVFCDGSGDGGIDVAFLQRRETTEKDSDVEAAGDSWFLIQSKYGAAFQGTGTLLKEAQKVIDTLDGKRHRLSSLSPRL